MKVDVIYNEDCLLGMSKLPDRSIDLLTCDPQYGWSFMDKDWDRAVPSVDIWKECFRVLKPGAFTFIMSGPRLDCLIENGMRIREAGFVISFTPIFWCFASGFPKAQNIGKAVDKRLGAERKVISISSTNGSRRQPRAMQPNGKGQRETIQKQTIPTSLQAQALDGSYGGFQPKPAVEVVIVVMKPLSEKTYVDQALANRHGISWLDEGRIPYSKNDDSRIGKGYSHKASPEFGVADNTDNSKGNKTLLHKEQGRFPANILVSDDVLNDGKSRPVSGSAKLSKPHTGGHLSGFMVAPQTNNLSPNDSGSFSRYFSLDAWFDKKLKELPEGVRRTFPFLIVPKASKSEKNRGCENLSVKQAGTYEGNIDLKKARKIGAKPDKPNVPTKNIHPTCKPIKLMSYLITLGSREGDIILDPFIGSGTTAIAAKMMRRHFIGYETDKEYVKIAKARLEAERTLWD